MEQKEIQAQLQALKQRLEAASVSLNGSSADLLLIVADLLLLMDQVKDSGMNQLLKQAALSRIQECQAELDGYHEHHEAIAAYTTVPLKIAGRSLGQAIGLMQFSFT